MTEHTVPIEVVRAALEVGTSQGFDMDALLARSGVSLELLVQDRARITVDQVCSVFHDLWRLTGDELFGLGPGPVPLGATRLVMLGAINNPDLRALMGGVFQYERLVPGFPRINTTEAGGTLRVELELSRFPEHGELVATTFLAVVHRVAGWLIGRRIRLQVVELPQESPANADYYQRVFGAPVMFDARCAAAEADAEVLDAPIVRSQDEWLEYAARAPLDLLTQRDYGTALSDRVRIVLSRGLQGGWPSADDVAASLAMSPQTLRRRLALEATSVTSIKEELLRDEAIASLVQGEETIEALSHRLGFSEPSSFRRAFRRWTGSPPRAYQHRVSAGFE